MNQPELCFPEERYSASSEKGTILVLASGGLDSSTLLWLTADQGYTPTALFLDYGQPAATAEGAAIGDLCKAIGVPLRRARYRGTAIGTGEIRGRNAYLLHAALMEFPSSHGVVALGIHAGTDYLDCSPDFVHTMQRSYEFHTGGNVEIVVPFLDWTKADIYSLADHLGVPIDLTYSCESSNLPCTQCRSCLDRDSLIREPQSC